MLQPLKNFLPSSVRRMGISYQVEASMVCERFNEVAAAMFGSGAELAKPLYLKGKILTINAQSPSLAQELQLNKERIIKKINERFNGEAVRQLRFLI